MKDFTLRAPSGECRVSVGVKLDKLADYAGAKTVFLVSDENILKLHPQKVSSWPGIKQSPGEKHKSLTSVTALYQAFLESGLTRDSLVVGVGGGTVCDLAAFAACTYLRGLHFGLAPTTLLAQADAGVGGKNGVNFGGFKNLVGVIRQPEFVLCDLEVLSTLPAIEIKNGLAEIIKAAAIGDENLFDFLEEHVTPVLQLEASCIEHIVFSALRVKAKIVALDENEQSERVKLNLGHTLGHAIESTQGIAHGQAVSIGMQADLSLSVARAGLEPRQARRITDLLKAYGLPTEISANRGEVLSAVQRDKKRHSGGLKLALLNKIGQASVASVALEDFLGAVP